MDSCYAMSPTVPGNSQPNDDEANVEKITIYMCKHCKSILGNDRFKGGVENEGKIIYFTELENCLMETVVKTSRQAFDLKCQYRNVECAQCHRHLGRQYCKVTEKLKHFDGLIGVALSEISSTSIRVPKVEKETDSDADSAQLKERVYLLEEKVERLTEKIEDLAVVCIDACKDRVGIKEAVANLLVLISNELGHN